ncbi:6406_t:CDS:2, partial [Gigaspora rosea]
MTNEKIIDRIVKKMEKEVVIEHWILSTLPNLKDEEDEKKNLEIPLLNYGSQPENI